MKISTAKLSINILNPQLLSTNHTFKVIILILTNIFRSEFLSKMGFPCGSAGKESAHNAGNLGSIPGLGRSPWRREGQSALVFLPENFTDGEAWWAKVWGGGHKKLDTTE